MSALGHVEADRLLLRGKVSDPPARTLSAGRKGPTGQRGGTRAARSRPASCRRRRAIVETFMIAGGTVYLVGAGGDPGLLTRRGLTILHTANVIVYDRLASASELLLEARPDPRLVYVGKLPDRHSFSQHEINEILAQEGHSQACRLPLERRRPLRLRTRWEEADHLAARRVPLEVVPGVTSALAAPACTGIPVTDRRVASSFAVVTGHGRPISTSIGRPSSRPKISRGADGHGQPEAHVDALLASRAPDTPAAVIEWGATNRRATVSSTSASSPPKSPQRASLRPPSSSSGTS